MNNIYRHTRTKEVRRFTTTPSKEWALVGNNQDMLNLANKLVKDIAKAYSILGIDERVDLTSENVDNMIHSINEYQNILNQLEFQIRQREIS